MNTKIILPWNADLLSINILHSKVMKTGGRGGGEGEWSGGEQEEEQEQKHKKLSNAIDTPISIEF